jgi:hypothetical protein
MVISSTRSTMFMHSPAQRMTHADCASEDIHTFSIQFQKRHVGQGDNGKGFIDFIVVNIAGCQSRCTDSLGNGQRGGYRESFGFLWNETRFIDWNSRTRAASAKPRIFASGDRPNSVTFRPLTRISADAPSLRVLAFGAVTVPAGSNAGRIALNFSTFN